MQESQIIHKPTIGLPVNVDWLVGVINRSCHGSEGVLNSYKCDRIGEGKGFLSRITRVSLHWDQQKSEGLDKLPKSVIIKKPTIDVVLAVDEMSKEWFNYDDLIRYHNQECKAYQFLTMHPPCPIPLAKHYYLEKMSQNDSKLGLIILEDLTDTAVNLKLFEDASKEKILNLAKYVAKLQAYGMKHKEEIEQFFDSDMVNPFVSAMKGLGAKLTTLRNDLGDDRMYFTNEQILGILNNAKKELQIFADPSQYGYTRVLNLGDVQAGNILWKRSETGEASDEVAAFIDFQMSHLGNCMNDLQFTLGYSMSTENRRKYQDEIMNHYLSTLRAELLSMGDGLADMSITKAEAVRVADILNAQLGCVWLGFMPAVKSFLAAHKIDNVDTVYDTVVDRVIDLLRDSYPIFGQKESVDN